MRLPPKPRRKSARFSRKESASLISTPTNTLTYFRPSCDPCCERLLIAEFVPCETPLAPDGRCAPPNFLRGQGCGPVTPKFVYCARSRADSATPLIGKDSSRPTVPWVSK